MTDVRARSTRALAVIGAVIVLLAAVALECVAVLGYLVACSDSCDPGSGRWRDDPRAWEYEFQLVLASIGAPFALLGVILAATGRLRGSGCAVAVALMTYGGWWGLVAGSAA